MVGYLRFILASLVLFSHLNYPVWKLGDLRINQGVYAVFCFYLISGFFTAVIYDRFSAGPKPVIKFYSDRLLRIMPTFWAVMLLVLCISIFIRFEPTLGATQADLRTPRNWFLAMLQPLNGIVAFFRRGDYPYGDFFGFTPVASLALEVQYFVIAPLFFFFRLRTIVAILLASAFMVGQSVFELNADLLENWSFRFLVGVLPTFLLGFLFYRHLQKPSPWWARAHWLGVALGLALFVTLVTQNPPSTKWAGELALALITCPFMLSLAMRRKSTPLDQLAGYASYGLFLAHIPVLRFLHLVGDSYWDFALALVLATLVAVLIHFLVERPVLKWRHAMAGRGLRFIQT